MAKVPVPSMHGISWGSQNQPWVHCILPLGTCPAGGEGKHDRQPRMPDLGVERLTAGVEGKADIQARLLSLQAGACAAAAHVYIKR